MSKVIKIDFLLNRLCRDVSSFYNKYYFGKDAEKRKGVHVMVLQEKYSTTKFSDDPQVKEGEVKQFLELVQRNVNGYTF